MVEMLKICHKICSIIDLYQQYKYYINCISPFWGLHSKMRNVLFFLKKEDFFSNVIIS